MLSRDYRDIVTGIVISAIGFFVILYVATHYELGTVRNFGPGLLPMALGVLLAVLGVLILVPAFLRAGAPVRFEVRPSIAVFVSVGVFAATVDHFGLIPAVTLLTLVAVLADNKLNIAGAATLAIALSVLAVVIFRIGLGMPIPAFEWPL